MFSLTIFNLVEVISFHSVWCRHQIVNWLFTYLAPFYPTTICKALYNTIFALIYPLTHTHSYSTLLHLYKANLNKTNKRFRSQSYTEWDTHHRQWGFQCLFQKAFSVWLHIWWTEPLTFSNGGTFLVLTCALSNNSIAVQYFSVGLWIQCVATKCSTVCI